MSSWADRHAIPPARRSRLAALVSRTPLWSLGALVIVTAIFAGVTAGLRNGRGGPNWDADGWFAPHYVYLSDHVRAGRLALWNPWTEGGVPTCAEPSAAAFSPIVLAFAWLTGPSLQGFITCWLSIWLLGAFGMFIFSRHLGAPVWGAFVVALGYLFSGIMTGHAEHISFIHSFAALPFFLWRLDAALRQDRALPAIEAGMILGLSALSGYPTVVLATAALSFLWVVGRLVCGDALASDSPAPGTGEPSVSSPGRRLWRAATSLVLAALVGLVVLSPTYVAFRKEAAGHSDRAQYVSRAECVEHNALLPRTMGTLGAPYIQVLALVNFPHWCTSDPVGLSLYSGAVGLWLALVALAANPRDRWRWWLIGIFLLGIVLAAGQTFPVRGWIHDLVPITRYFRHTVAFRCYSAVAVCVLTSLAARDIQLRRLSSWCQDSGALLISSSVLALAAIAVHWREVARVADAGPDRALADVHILVVWGAVALLGFIGTLSFRDAGARKAFPLILCLVAAVDAIFTGRLLRPFYEHRDPRVLGHWKHLMSEHKPELEGLGDPPVVPILGTSFKSLLTKTRVPLLKGFNTLKNRFCAEWVASPPLLQTIREHRVMFSPGAVEAPPSAAAFAMFKQRAAVAGTPPLLVHSRDSLRAAGAEAPLATDLADAILHAPACRPLPVEFLRYTTDKATMRVKSPEQGWIIFFDRWASGWRATVNGQEQPILGGMFLYRALRVPAGVSEIRFWYRPYGYPLLLIASWLTILIVLVCSGASWWVRRQRSFADARPFPAVATAERAGAAA